MNKKLNCDQVKALLSFYADGTLNKILSKCVKEHIESCPDCMSELIDMKERYKKSIKKINIDEDETLHQTKNYEEFKKNLSAYIDNELDDSENIKIKKIAISNPLARKDLENIYTFKKILLDSYLKTQNEMKYDYSKAISALIQQEIKGSSITDPFYKVAVLFFILLGFLITGIITMLYF